MLVSYIINFKFHKQVINPWVFADEIYSSHQIEFLSHAARSKEVTRVTRDDALRCTFVFIFFWE